MDTISNMLTTIINAQRVGKARVAVPYSRYRERLAQLLQEKGLIAKVRVQEGSLSKLVLTLAYGDDKQPRISGVRRLSTPGQRRYVKHANIPYAFDSRGLIVLSTPGGLMDDAQARQQGLGGELVCEIW